MGLNKLIEDSKYLDLATIQETVSKMMLDCNYSTDTFTSFTFNGFFRARKHNHLEGELNKKGDLHKFTNETEFWNPPNKDSRIGRCNEERESLFYCSSDFITAILEVKPVAGDFVTVANFKNLYPQNKPEFRIYPIGRTYLIKIPELALSFENYILDKSQF